MATSTWAPIFCLEEAPPAPAGDDGLATGIELVRLGSRVVFYELPPCPSELGLTQEYPWQLTQTEWNHLRLRLRHDTENPSRQAPLEWLHGGVRLAGGDIEGQQQPMIRGAYHHVVLRGLLAGHLNQNQAYRQAADLFYREYLLRIVDTGPFRQACQRYLAELGPGAEVLRFTSASYAHMTVILDTARQRAATFTPYGNAKIIEPPSMDALLKAVEAGALPCRLPQPPTAKADPMEPVEPTL